MIGHARPGVPVFEGGGLQDEEGPWPHWKAQARKEKPQVGRGPDQPEWALVCESDSRVTAKRLTPMPHTGTAASEVSAWCDAVAHAVGLKARTQTGTVHMSSPTPSPTPQAGWPLGWAA